MVLNLWRLLIPAADKSNQISSLSRRRRVIGMLLVLLIFAAQGLRAQQRTQTLRIRLDRDTSSEEGPLKPMVVKLYNPGLQAWAGKPGLQLDSGIRLIGRLPDNLKLAAGDSLFFLLKLFVSPKLASGSYSLVLSLTDPQGGQLRDTSRFLVPVIRRVMMSTPETEISLYSHQQSLQIPVRLQNSGNTRERVNIVANYPVELDPTSFHKAFEVLLAPFSDTLIELKKGLHQARSLPDNFDVTITGLYTNGDFFGQGDIQFVDLKSQRLFLNPKNQPAYRFHFNNSLSVQGEDLGSRAAYYDVFGNSSIQFPGAAMGFNLNGIFRTQDLQSTYLRNTYVSLETPRLGIVAGNINRNFDLNLIGRGVAVFTRSQDGSGTLEAGYMDNASNLLEKSGNVYTQGRVSWGSYSYHSKLANLQTDLLYQKDPFYKINNTLEYTTLQLFTHNHFLINGSLGLGNSSFQQDASIHKPGISGSFGLSKNWGSFALNTMNTLSSRYYPGLKKGAHEFSERMSYTTINGWTWSASLDAYSYHPKYVSPLYHFSSEYGNARYQIGISHRFGQTSVSLDPHYSSNYGQFSLINQIVLLKLNAARLGISVFRFNAETNHTLMLNTDLGLGSNPVTGHNELQIKSLANLNLGSLYISGMYQQGAFYAGEAYGLFLSHLTSYRLLNISPMYQKKFLRNRLQLQAGVSFNNSSISGNYWSLNGTLQYTLNSKTLLNVGLMTNHTGLGGYTTNNIQAGIVQNLNQPRLGIRYNVLRVFVYKDLNNDNHYDKGDSAAGQQVIRINNIAFITDRYGKVEYKNLPSGNYPVSVTMKSGWYAEEHTVHLRNKHQTDSLALHLTGMVNGTIAYVFNEFSYSVEKPLEGIPVFARAKDSTVVQSATDQDGHFVLYLPEGTYTIGIQPENLPQNVDCTDNFQSMTVKASQEASVHFVLQVRSKILKVKRFVDISAK